MIHDNLLALTARAPLTSGLRQGDTFTPYAALLERIARTAAGLADRGVARGDVVALLLPNSPDLFVAAHALFALGAIAMPLSPAATPAERAALAAKTGLRAVIAAPAADRSRHCRSRAHDASMPRRGCCVNAASNRRKSAGCMKLLHECRCLRRSSRRRPLPGLAGQKPIAIAKTDGKHGATVVP